MDVDGSGSGEEGGGGVFDAVRVGVQAQLGARHSEDRGSDSSLNLPHIGFV